MKYCEDCKKMFSDEEKKCPLCGGKLIEAKAKGIEKDSDLLLEDYEYDNDFRDW